MRRNAALLALLFLFLAGSLPAQQPREFFFKNGDRIIFLGDSITEQYQYYSEGSEVQHNVKLDYSRVLQGYTNTPIAWNSTSPRAFRSGT